jgi:CHAT domain-containing protein/Tfp pilus assembly protein PilF
MRFRPVVSIPTLFLVLALAATQEGFAKAKAFSQGLHETGPRTTQSLPDFSVLRIGKVIERDISGHDRHQYRLPLEAGQFVHVTLERHGIEVTVSLLAPHGEPLLQIDTSDGSGGARSLFLRARESGSYRLELRASEAQALPGHYEIRLQELHAFTARDGVVEQGQQAFIHAEELRRQDTATSLREAAENGQQAAKLWHKADYRLGEAEAHSLLGDVLRSLGQNRRALEELQGALLQFAALHDLAGGAAAGDRIANVYYSLGDLKKALEVVTRDHAVWLDLADIRREAQNLTYMGTLYFTLGNRAKALDCFEKALPMRRQVRDRHGEGETLNETGLVYDASGEKQKALEYFNQALEIRRLIGDRRGQAASLFNIGVSYATMADLPVAIDYFKQALPLRRAVGNKTGEALTLYRMGSVYVDLGEEQRALDLYRQAHTLLQSVGDRRGEAYTLNGLGSTYLSLGDGQRARGYCTQALRISRTIADPRGAANALHTLGGVYLVFGEQQRALNYYKQSLTLRHSVSDRRGEAATLSMIGEIEQARGNHQNALDYFNQVLVLAENTSDPGTESKSLRDIGATYYSLRENATALDYYRRALALQQELSDRPAQLTTLYGMAQVEEAIGKLEEAEPHAKAALALIEELRSRVASQELRTFFFGTQHQVYEFYIDLLMQMDRQHPGSGFDAKAIETVERNRARSLVETLAEAGADIREGVDAQIVERERSLKQVIEAKSVYQVRILSSKHTEQQASAVKNQIDELLHQYQDVEEQIRTTSPSYAALTQPRPLTAQEVQQQLLDADTVLLEYALGETRSFVFLLTPTSLDSYELPKRSDIESIAHHAYELLTSRNSWIEGERNSQVKERRVKGGEEYQKTVGTLSQMILGPVAARLEGKRLLIVADGALQYIPFAILPVPPGSAAKPAVPLVAEHEIINLPSASVLALLRRQANGRGEAPKEVAVLADPVFDKDDPRVRKARKNERTPNSASEKETIPVVCSQLSRSLGDVGVGTPESRFALARLAFSRREAETIMRMTDPGQGLEALDFRANRTTATSPELARYRIIHFATHGLIDSEHPELSGLVLSLVDQKGKPDNGFLELQDIYNFKLSADLVVLSACKTALGKEVKGEGLLGLTRGFMYAGVPRVVASLWEVDDVATADLMGSFYRAMLREGLQPAAALRQAQMEMSHQKRWSNPYYWGAFTIQGEWK